MTERRKTVVEVIDETLAATEGVPRDQRAQAIADAVDALMGEHHVLVIGEEKWSIEHPLACRLAGLDKCQVQARAVAAMEEWSEGAYGPLPGRYVLTLDPDHDRRVVITAER